MMAMAPQLNGLQGYECLGSDYCCINNSDSTAGESWRYLIMSFRFRRICSHFLSAQHPNVFTRQFALGNVEYECEEAAARASEAGGGGGGNDAKKPDPLAAVATVGD